MSLFHVHYIPKETTVSCRFDTHILRVKGKLKLFVAQ